MEVPPRTLSLYRTLLTAESVATELVTINFRDVTQRFFESLATDEIMKAIEPESLKPVLLNLFSIWRDSPLRIHEALSDLAEGRLRINAAVVESAKTASQRNRRTRLVAAAVPRSAWRYCSSYPDCPRWGDPLQTVIVAVLLADYAYLLFNWRLK